MGDDVNVLIDQSSAFAYRLIDLPLSVWLLSAGGCASVVVMFLWRSQQRSTCLARVLVFGSVAILVIGALLVLLLDRKLGRMEARLGSLETRVTNTSARVQIMLSRPEVRGALRTTPRPVAGRQGEGDSGLSTVPELASLGPVTAEHYELHPSVTFTMINRSVPPLAAFAISISLTDPRISLVLSPQIAEKTTTSKFATDNRCSVAVNGEAGVSPGPAGGFGEWSGPFVSGGKVLSSELSYKRPTLQFAANKRVMFVAYPTAIPDPGKTPNVIWGRAPLIEFGRTIPQPNDSPYARTIMGSDGTGERLILLVADGKQPYYSMGLSYSEATAVMKWLGADSAMACDQGGSSSMFVRDLGGIVNRPADGRERGTFTHFGIRIEEEDGR